MREIYSFLVLIAFWLPSYAQIKFNEHILQEDMSFLKPIKQSFGGISGIEYIPGLKQWILVSDRGHYFKFRDCKSTSDFKLSNMIAERLTNNFFESIRYYPDSNSYFFSVETDNFTGVYYSRDQVDFNQSTEILKISPLPAENKGIEAIAVTSSGVLWVAPEAGWKGETLLTRNYVHFYRYVKPLQIGGQPELFQYPIKRFPGAKEKEDQFGGISEILAVDETHLLVLERAYYKCPEDRVVAFLRNVTVDEDRKMLIIENEDAFDLNSIPNLCNIEGMSWGDNDKKSLFLIGDDGLGTVFHSELKNATTGRLLKPTLRNQMILLRRD